MPNIISKLRNAHFRGINKSFVDELIKIAVNRVELLSQEAKYQFSKKYKDAPINSDDKVYGLKHGKNITGGAVLHTIRNEPVMKKFRDGVYKPKHFLSFFYIDKEHRGQGAGDKILSKILNGKKRVILRTDNNKDNAAAKHLYYKYNFVPVKKEKRFTFWANKDMKKS